MAHLIDRIFTNFWCFMGFLIILYTILYFAFLFWNRFWRHWNIHKHGYPPNTDADGDFPNTYEEN